MSSEPQAQRDADQPRLSRGEVLNYLLVFVWLGLLVGMAEALVRLGVCLTKGHFLFISDHFLWMTPVAEAVGVWEHLGVALVARVRMQARAAMEQAA